jgi:hypothetical protein
MANYAYSVTRDGKPWKVVNRGNRTLILGPYDTQKDAEDAAERRAKRRAAEGHIVRVFIEDEEGSERLRHTYPAPGSPSPPAPKPPELKQKR